jgi:hypothetical protein
MEDFFKYNSKFNSLFKDSLKTSLASITNGKGKRVTKGKLSVRRLDTRSGESAKAKTIRKAKLGIDLIASKSNEIKELRKKKT